MTDRDQNPSALFGDPLLQDAPVVDGYKFLAPVLIYERIGEGGMGAVYRGRHTNFDIDVAVKVLKPELARDDPSYVQRFRFEAQMAVRLDHQNLIRVLDVQTDGRLCYMVMELVTGETAAERVMRKGPLAEDEAVRIVLAAAEGLAAAHDANVVHRDIKPDNILISTEGKVKVADLGLARPADGGTGLTQVGLVIGTPQYMAPEQWEGVRLDARVDVWALGATLWFLLAGTNPFERSSHGREVPDLASVRQGISAELLAVLRRSTTTELAKRHADAGELAAALRPLLTSSGTLADRQAMAGPAVTMVSPPPGPRTIEMARTRMSADAATRVAIDPLAKAPPDDGKPVRVKSRRGGAGAGLPGWGKAALGLIVLVPAVLWAFGVFGGGGSGGSSGGKPPGPPSQVPGQGPAHVPQPVPQPAPTAVAQLAAAAPLLEAVATLDDGVRQLEDLARGHADLPGLSAALARGYALQVERDEAKDPSRAYRAAAKWATMIGAAGGAHHAANSARERLATALQNRLANGTDSLPAWPCEVLDPTPGALTGYPQKVRDRATDVVFLLVEPGEFAMGSSAAGQGPVHTVVLTRPFYLAATETTQAQWRSIRTGNPGPSEFPGDNRPVNKVSWLDVEAFLRLLNGGAEGPFRLPSEAEWEYACRAGSTTAYSFGAAITTANAQYDNSGTVDVRTFPPNGLGFHELHGNVWEWCGDWFDPGYYATLGERTENPPGPASGDLRVARGGSFSCQEDQLSSANRYGFQPATRLNGIGFRLVRSL